jgi:hypothetical protein
MYEPSMTNIIYGTLNKYGISNGQHNDINWKNVVLEKMDLLPQAQLRKKTRFWDGIYIFRCLNNNKKHSPVNETL